MWLLLYEFAYLQRHLSPGHVILRVLFQGVKKVSEVPYFSSLGARPKQHWIGV